MDLARSLNHLDEVFALLAYKLAGQGRPKSYGELSVSALRCYDYLNRTSRSFAAVIQALDDELRMPVCLFYLVLRGLDTIEDDMSLPVPTKTALLSDFHNSIKKPGWTFTGNGPSEKDRFLLCEFDVVIEQFLLLKPEYQDVIQDITQRMASGMCHYACGEAVQVVSLADWDHYCHHVAGLVGIGLSRLFAASGLEDASVGHDDGLGNSMGLFLQKVNIIRDYREDLHDGRRFWPQCVWAKHASALQDLACPDHRAQARACLNELITNALEHIPDLFAYMQRLRNPSVISFCAIPQVMAIATLAECYNNGRVFEGVVKIRKGLAVRLIREATCMASVLLIFQDFLEDIQARIPPNDPSAAQTHAAVARGLALCAAAPGVQQRQGGYRRTRALCHVRPWPHVAVLLCLGGLAYYVARK